VTPDTDGPREPEDRPAPRVALQVHLDSGYQSGPVDGAWWPQSRDLATEMVDLVDHLSTLLGGIDKVLFSRPDWDAWAGLANTHLLECRTGPVRLSSFPSDDTHLVVVTMRSGQRYRLLVIPSTTAPSEAAEVMEQAADERNTRGPAELLGLLGHDQSHIGFDSWNQ
jgi:hypothetical protein